MKAERERRREREIIEQDTVNVEQEAMEEGRRRGWEMRGQVYRDTKVIMTCDVSRLRRGRNDLTRRGIERFERTREDRDRRRDVEGGWLQ